MLLEPYTSHLVHNREASRQLCKEFHAADCTERVFAMSLNAGVATIFLSTARSLSADIAISKFERFLVSSVGES